MKIVNAIAFITLSCLVGVCQPMEIKRKSSFRKFPAHRLEVLDPSKYVQTINGILSGIIENNNGIITNSEKLQDLESSQIKNETASLVLALTISRGEKHNLVEGIIPNTEGRIGYYFLEGLIKSTFELGLLLEQLVAEEKIDKEFYRTYIFHFGELSMIYNKVQLFKELCSVSEEKPIGSPKNDSHDNCLMQ